ncbi:MAG: hypothetical protein LC732_06375 [Acidobacteria bacterium]|nr:hypothetical protein [Acidobacteriota bacterium]
MRGGSGSLLTGVILFAIAFLVFATIFLSFPLIPDGDSYFHLAVAREFAENGYPDGLAWARLSTLGETYGDKELLFHLLLVPFAGWMDPVVGGRLALAFFNAFIFSVVGVIARGFVGSWGVVVPLFLYLTAGSFIARVFRLRPELLSLILLLLVIVAATKRRYLLVAILSAAYALSYTAFQALVGLAGLWTLVEWVREKRFPWKLPLSVVGGVAAGLLLHPGFPDNLRIWWIQNVLFFRFRDVLDVGGEIFAPIPMDVLLFNLGWWIGLVVLGLAMVRGGERRPATRESLYFAVATVAFAILFIKMDRMSIYFFPFATLWLVAEMQRRGMALTSTLELHRALRLPTLLLIALFAAASLPKMTFIVETLRTRGSSEADFAAAAQAIPSGAKVAAEWGPTEHYVFWQPRARYLNVLDPIFMARSHPGAYELQRRVFSGVEPDVPLAVVVGLDSDYLAYERAGMGGLERRLRRDPRARLLYAGENAVVAFQPFRNDAFILDWEMEDGAGRMPYPRMRDAKGRRAEGYVNALRVIPPGEPCVTLVHEMLVEAPTAVNLELSSYGPATMWFNGEEIASIPRGTEAVLGSGTLAQLALTSGRHELRIRTCRSAPRGAVGFYLLQRGGAQGARDEKQGARG